MKTRYGAHGISGALIRACLGMTGVPPDPSRKIARGLNGNERSLVSATATVHSMDSEKREITLIGQDRACITLTVDPRVKRLNNLSAGDAVAAKYYASVALEIQTPSRAERPAAATLLDDTVKAPEGTTAVDGVLRVFRVVAIVAGVDRFAQALRMRWPFDRQHTVWVKNAEMLDRFQSGDPIVVTYTEALAIDVHKVKSRNNRG